MQNLRDLHDSWSADMIDALGGEALAGSGFESDAPEPDFSAEFEGEE
jgi:hypothetical protein